MPSAADIEVHRRQPGRLPILLQGFNVDAEGIPEDPYWDKKSPAGKFFQALRAGAYTETAAKFARIGIRAIREWYMIGREVDPDTPDEELTRIQILCRRFLVEYEDALYGGEMSLVLAWRRGADVDWRAARDLLARRHPERWSEKQQVEHTGSLGLEVEVEPGPTARKILDNQRAREFALAAIDALEDGSDVEDAELVEEGEPVLEVGE